MRTYPAKAAFIENWRECGNQGDMGPTQIME